MRLASTNLSRLKACQKLAGGKPVSSRRSAAKAEGRRPRSASPIVTTLKGWQNPNPNGVPSLSPGLERSDYPGSSSNRFLNPERVVSGQTQSNPVKPDPSKGVLLRAPASSQLRRSEIFVENQSLQNPKLRRSGISMSDNSDIPNLASCRMALSNWVKPGQTRSNPSNLVKPSQTNNVPNPNGVPSSSPGLERSDYPGSNAHLFLNPERVVSKSTASQSQSKSVKVNQSKNKIIFSESHGRAPYGWSRTEDSHIIRGAQSLFPLPGGCLPLWPGQGEGKARANSTGHLHLMPCLNAFAPFPLRALCASALKPNQTIYPSRECGQGVNS